LGPEKWADEIDRIRNTELSDQGFELREVTAFIPSGDGQDPSRFVRASFLPGLQKRRQPFLRMQAPEVEQDFSITAEIGTPGRWQTLFHGVGDFRAIRDDTDRVSQAAGANGERFRAVCGVKTEGTLQMPFLEQGGRDTFFPTRISQRPGIEHAVRRDEIRFGVMA
jgi:hypothetical protein